MKKEKLRRASKRSAPKIDQQLTQLESAQLVRRVEEVDLAYIFKHALTQETAYESLLLKHRRAIHRHVAESYEKLYAEHLDEYAALLVQHYAEAGDDAKTLEYAMRAGDVAARVYANTEAIQFYERALELSHRNGAGSAILIPLYTRRGRAYELSSRFAEALRGYEEMLALARARGDRQMELAALTLIATLRSLPGSTHDSAQSQALSDQALVLARELDDRGAQAKILWNLLLLQIYGGGDPKRAVEYGEQSIAIAREHNLREQLAFTLHDIFVAYIFTGDAPRALAAREQAAALWREFDNKPMLSECLTGLGMYYFLTNDPERALQLAHEGYELGESIGNLNGMAFAGQVLGYFYLDRGEPIHAIESLQVALATAEERGLEGPGLEPQAELGWIYACLGDFERGLQLVRAALTKPLSKSPQMRAWLYSLITRIELQSGEVQAAGEAFRAGGVIPSIEYFYTIFPLAGPMMPLAGAELALAQGDNARALDIANEMLAYLNQVQLSTMRGDALLIQAQALRAQGKMEEAYQSLAQARALAEANQSRRVLWRILASLGELETARGNLAAAQTLRERAREIIEYIAAHTPEELRASFLNLPRVRDIVQRETN